MPQSSKLRPPPPIDAISNLDDLEKIADEFRTEKGYCPELLSHWDPKLEFDREIGRWINWRNSTESVAQYVYSSYLPINGRIQERLREQCDRGYLILPSSTTAIALVITYLNSVGIRSLQIITPAYFAAEALANQLRISVSILEVQREQNEYSFPKEPSLAADSAIWITLPIYGTSCYLPAEEVARFIDRLPDTAVVIVDESLAYSDRDSLSAVQTMGRVIRIASPHKALCINGEKVSFITFPNHLWRGMHAWSECFAGGIGASGLRALQFLTSAAFDHAISESRLLYDKLFNRLVRVLGTRSTVSLDKNTDGHFVMLHWPNVPMAVSRDLTFMKELISATGTLPIPASRQRHPDRYGFSFRTNLLRLDNAGLGGLSRLADFLDECV